MAIEAGEYAAGVSPKHEHSQEGFATVGLPDLMSNIYNFNKKLAC